MMEFKINAIYCGDCKDVLRKFPEESFDLIYLDPPFSSNRIYNIAFGTNYERRAYTDRWRGGIYGYLNYMEPRIRECRRVLKSHGLIYYHCDWHASHYIKIMLDEVFHSTNYRNEIIVCYSGGGIPKKDFPRKHDTIFRYSKDFKDFAAHGSYNPIYRPYSMGTLKVGGGRHSLTSGGDSLDIQRGTVINDWWTDVHVAPTSYQSEWMTYPTQKAEALLMRILETSSNPTDIVLDPFCGCGTTLVAAYKLNRRFIGIDIAPLACKEMQRRMREPRFMGASTVDVPIVGMPKSINEIKQLPPLLFQSWVCDALFAHESDRKSKDEGIDGWLVDGTPLQVKKKEKVGAPMIKNFRTSVRDKKKTKGVLVAFSFTKDAYKEQAKAMRVDGIEMDLKTIDLILKEQAGHDLLSFT